MAYLCQRRKSWTVVTPCRVCCFMDLPTTFTLISRARVSCQTPKRLSRSFPCAVAMSWCAVTHDTAILHEDVTIRKYLSNLAFRLARHAFPFGPSFPVQICIVASNESKHSDQREKRSICPEEVRKALLKCIRIRTRVGVSRIASCWPLLGGTSETTVLRAQPCLP